MSMSGVLNRKRRTPSPPRGERVGVRGGLPKVPAPRLLALSDNHYAERHWPECAIRAILQRQDTHRAFGHAIDSLPCDERHRRFQPLVWRGQLQSRQDKGQWGVVFARETRSGVICAKRTTPVVQAGLRFAAVFSPVRFFSWCSWRHHGGKNVVLKDFPLTLPLSPKGGEGKDDGFMSPCLGGWSCA